MKSKSNIDITEVDLKTIRSILNQKVPQMKFGLLAPVCVAMLGNFRIWIWQ